MNRRVLALLLVVAVTVVAVLFFTRQGDQADATVTVSVVNPVVTREPAGGQASEVLDGDALNAGDAIRTDADGRALLAFFDGSSVSLEPETRVVVRELSRHGNGTYTVVLEQTEGTTWANVEKVRDASSRFEIKVPDATAVVRGTSLLTQVGKGGTSAVIVAEGHVQLVTVKGTKDIPAGGLGVYRQDDKTFYDQDACADPFASLRFSSFGLQMNPCSNTSRLSWRLQVTTDSGTAGKITDYYGRACGEGKSQIPMCGASGAVGVVRGPQAGEYLLTLRPATGAGRVGALFEVTGTSCGGYFYIDCRSGVRTQQQRIAFDALPQGALVRMPFRIHETTSGLGYELSQAAQVVLPDPATPKPSAGPSAGPSPSVRPVLRGSRACVADAPGQAFASGTVVDRSSEFNAFAAAYPGRTAALVVSEDDVGSALSDAVKQSPVSVSDVRASIGNSRLRVTGQATAFALGLDVQLSVRQGKLDLSYRIDGVPQWAQGQLPTAPLTAWLEGMNSGPAKWQRVLWRDGCLALVGSGAGTAGATAPAGPTAPPALAKRYGPGTAGIYGLGIGAGGSPATVDPGGTVEVAVEGCSGAKVTLQRWARIEGDGGLRGRDLDLSYFVAGDPFVIRMDASSFAPGQNFFDWKDCAGHAWQTSATIVSAPRADPSTVPAPPPSPQASPQVTVGGAPSPSPQAATGVRQGPPPAPLGAPGRADWTPVGTWSGSGQSRSTGYFTVTASQWRVSWTLTGYCCLEVKITEIRDGISRQVHQSADASGTVQFNGPGYFSVSIWQVTSSPYSITVEEGR